MEDSTVPSEPIYKGATRPAIVLGVPLGPAVGLVCLGSPLAVWTGYYASGWAAIVTGSLIAAGLLWMYAVTKVDDQRVYQYRLQRRLTGRQRNLALWHCRSYSPVCYGKAYYGRHR